MIWTLLSFATTLIASVVQPERASCPQGWWVNGVRYDGVYECLRVPEGRENDSPQPDGWLIGRIYCATRPVVENERTVACSRRADPS